MFSILISNTDDHLRNHGFLFAGPEGWRLSPAVAAEVGRSVATWRDVAARTGIGKPEIGRMASAFEHDDLKKALA